MTLVWVLGSGGMLGSSIHQKLQQSSAEIFVPIAPLPWKSESELLSALEVVALTFVQRANELGAWEIYWAAGIGNMGSSAADMLLETTALARLLQILAPIQSAADSPSAAIAFASTAGAIYAGCASDDIVSEDSLPQPTTPYAWAKLAQERLLIEFAAQQHNVRILIARLSTVYGPRRSSKGRQGLLAHMAQCVVRNQPIQVFVPLDTARDYISSTDAASAMVAAVQGMGRQSKAVIKIVASEHPTTIAQVISIFRRITRRPPRIVTSTNHLSHLYSRCVRYKSGVVVGTATREHSNLLIGIAQLLESERVEYVSRGER